MTSPPPCHPVPTRSPSRFGIPIDAGGSGKILRLKIGYNPNSSSIGTIVFGMPATLAVVTVAFGTAAGILCAALLRNKASGRLARPGSPAADEPATQAAANAEEEEEKEQP